MASNVDFLKAYDLSDSSRRVLVERLQNDTTWVEGDSSYKIAYYRRLYDLAKVRCIEGVDDDYLWFEYGLHANNYFIDSVVGDSAGRAHWRDEMNKILGVIKSQYHYRSGQITIEQVFQRMCFNSVYSTINMNTFNFINATFDNLYGRYPTQSEFDSAWNMIENNQSVWLLGQNGQNQGDYLEIITSSREFYEGLVTWMYQTLLGREPTAIERADLMATFYVDKNFQEMQVKIMIGDDYANF